NIMSYVDHLLKFSPNQMRVTAKALKSYLYMADLKGNDENYMRKALNFLDEALSDNVFEVDAAEEDGPIGDKVILLANKAWLLYNMGKMNEVDSLITEIESFREQMSDKAGAYSLAYDALTKNWFSRNNYKSAIQCYKLAMECVPDHVDWLFGYTRLIAKTENQVELLDKIPAITEEETQYGLARVHLARCLLKKGSEVEALHHVDRALEDDGNNPIVVQRVGEIYRKMGKFDDAIEILAEALDSSPDSSFILNEIGLVFKGRFFKKKHGKTDHALLLKSINYFHDSSVADPSNIIAKANLAQMYLGWTGICYDFEKKNMQKRLVNDKQDLEALKLIGWVNSKTGYLDSASFYYERAYEVDSLDPNLLIRLVEVCVKAENIVKADKYIEFMDSKKEEYKKLKAN
ncbi:antiviral innate immune response effector IFIT1-like, partial [Saccoglossus kowalevskii]